MTDATTQRDWDRVAADLRKLDRLLMFRWNWVKNASHRAVQVGPYHIHRFCITGGLNHVNAARGTSDFLRSVSDKAGSTRWADDSSGYAHGSLESFNDAGRTTFRDIKRLIRTARREAKRRRRIVM